LGISLILTPKCHPETSGCGVEYCWGYAKALLIHIMGREDAAAGKDNIEHIIKFFKAHHSAMDADYGFIASA